MKKIITTLFCLWASFAQATTPDQAQIYMDANITSNGQNAITGSVLNSVLTVIIDAMKTINLATGTVTSILTNACLTGGPITLTGTIGIIPGCLTDTYINILSASKSLWTPPGGTGPVPRTLQIRGQDWVSLGDFCSSVQISADISSCFTNAIAYASSTAGRVWVPATFNGALITGSVAITTSNVDIECAAVGTAFVASGTSNTIQIGFQVGQINNIHISNCTFSESAKTNGFTIAMKNVGNVILDRIISNDPYNCLYFEKYNNVSVNFPSCQNVRGQYGHRVVAFGSDRADVLQITNSSVNCNWHGGQGFSIDGLVFTTRWYGANYLDCSIGFHVDNSGGAGNFPQYFEAHGLEIDGASQNAMRFDSGSDFMCDSCVVSNTSGSSGQGGADGPALVINPDSGRTRRIYFTGSQIKDSRIQAAAINGTLVGFTGGFMGDAAKGSATNVVDVGSSAVAVSFSGVQFDGANRALYCAAFDNAASFYTAVGNICIGYVTDAFLYSGATSNKVIESNAK